MIQKRFLLFMLILASLLIISGCTPTPERNRPTPAVIYVPATPTSVPKETVKICNPPDPFPEGVTPIARSTVVAVDGAGQECAYFNKADLKPKEESPSDPPSSAPAPTPVRELAEITWDAKGFDWTIFWIAVPILITAAVFFIARFNYLKSKSKGGNVQDEHRKAL